MELGNISMVRYTACYTNTSPGVRVSSVTHLHHSPLQVRVVEVGGGSSPPLCYSLHLQSVNFNKASVPTAGSFIHAFATLLPRQQPTYLLSVFQILGTVKLQFTSPTTSIVRCMAERPRRLRGKNTNVQ